MRTIAVANLDALEAGSVSRAYLARFDFPSGVVAVHGGVGAYTFGGNTYQGLGRFSGGVSAISEGSDAKPRGVTFMLTGVDVALLDKVQDGNFVGRDADLYMLMFNPVDLQPVTSPWIVWSGFMDTMRYQIGPGAFDLQLACESRFVKLARRNTRRRTDADQQSRFPGDLFFQFVDQLRYHKVELGGVGIAQPGRNVRPNPPGSRPVLP